MWIHEGFTTYSECLFVDYYYGKEAGNAYTIGIRKWIKNEKTIIGKYDVNFEGSGDMYPKGANMLHTLRQIVNDDEKWRTILRGLNSTFYHQTVTTKQIEDYLSNNIGLDLAPFFNQYLRNITIPTFEYKFKDNILSYRWNNCVPGFNIPVKVTFNGKEQWMKPQAEWTNLPQTAKDFKVEVDKNFYVNVMKSKE